MIFSGSRSVLYFCCVLFLVSAEDASLQDSTKAIQASQKKLSQQILILLEHYKQKDPVGIPGAPIPDPMDIPPMKHTLAVGTMNFKDVKSYGMSKFRMQHVKVDVAAMQVEAALTIDKLNVFGNYTLRSWFSSAQGPFTVTLTQVYVKTLARLEVQRNGRLEAQDMDMDIQFKNIEMDFKNLGFLASMFQGMMNSVGTFIFDSIKPFILKEVKTNVRKDVNKQVSKISQKFPNSISPFDQGIAELRKEIRNRGFDPYKVNDYNTSVGIFDIYMTHTWVTGLSSVHRVGNITFEIMNNTVLAVIETGTQKLEGTSHWEVALVSGIVSRAGTVAFTVNYFKVKVALSQSTDTSKPPKLEDIQLELGNIQARFDGAGTMDYVIEFGINVIPNILRYQIMDALESPIKQRIQEALDNVVLENIIKENIDKLDDPRLLEKFLKQ